MAKPKSVEALKESLSQAYRELMALLIAQTERINRLTAKWHGCRERLARLQEHMPSHGSIPVLIVVEKELREVVEGMDPANLEFKGELDALFNGIVANRDDAQCLTIAQKMLGKWQNVALPTDKEVRGDKDFEAYCFFSASLATCRVWLVSNLKRLERLRVSIEELERVNPTHKLLSEMKGEFQVGLNEQESLRADVDTMIDKRHEIHLRVCLEWDFPTVRRQTEAVAEFCRQVQRRHGAKFAS